ncbi:MAG: TIGR01244 family protein [Sphingomonadales bacterium 32-68-7]|nr:MAG: TIGR01244 family protein [Sphingomonadales bacterium 12-68-11]OYX08807.1 MAG: TIGR01244 family protein [Sphingomonadales bacterium 32-68-7]
MSDFRRVSAAFWASPQIELEDVAEAKALGAAMIVNNRPDGEEPGAPQGAEIERAARDAGLAYRAIPVTHAGFSAAQVEAMVSALREAGGPVLAYCRSGTRSTLLWSLAQAAEGREPDAIAQDAAGAGYDVAPIRPLLEQLHSRAQA